MIGLGDLSGKTIIVTGAAQGCGAGVVRSAYDLGASVVAVDMDEETLITSLADYDESRVLGITGNVAKKGFADQVVAASIDKFTAVHGLVNNAGNIRPAMIHKMSDEDWQSVIDVHLTGSFYFLRAVGSHLRDRAEAGEHAPGAIINISSDAGRGGTIGQINYGSAKAGIFGMTKSAAREWGKFGITVNAVCFGMVETQMTEVVRGDKFVDKYLAQIPLGRFTTPKEVSRPICFLLSDDAKYITGQTLAVNGGFRME